MNMRLWTAAALLFSSSFTSVAMAAPSAAEIDDAKQSLFEAADDGFVKGWNERGDVVSEAGMNASEVRSWGRWMVMGYSIGACQASVPGSLMADWLTAFDRLSFGVGDASVRRNEFRQKGSQLMAQGQREAPYGHAGTASYNRLCQADLAAIADILRHPF